MLSAAFGVGGVNCEGVNKNELELNKLVSGGIHFVEHGIQGFEGEETQAQVEEASPVQSERTLVFYLSRVALQKVNIAVEETVL